MRTREQSERLAWRPWELIGAGDIDGGLALFSDEGTWWDMVTRTEGSMKTMKSFLKDTFTLIPMRFDFVGSIVEEDRVALMVESFADLPNGTTYNNVYTFVTALDPVAELVTSIREYVDTMHAFQVLIPAIMGATPDGASGSALTALLGRDGSAE